MKYFLLSLFAMTSVAHAAYYVECGKNFSEAEAGFQKVAFKASSGTDTFTGPNGNNWEVALSQNWLAPKKALAKVERVNGEKRLSVKVSNGQAGISEIGQLYVIEQMYDDYPTLKVFNIGGFAGGTQIGSFECYTAID